MSDPNKNVLETDSSDTQQLSVPASILNHALGPIMRGPSSSHCAAGHRIGCFCLALLGGTITSLTARYSAGTALAETHSGQGTDMGLYGGILGLAVDDCQLENFLTLLDEREIRIEVQYPETDVPHPSYYDLTIANETELHQVEAISIGGGMIEVVKIDGAEVSIAGDYFELIVFGQENPDAVATRLAELLEAESIAVRGSGDTAFVEVKSAAKFDAELIHYIRKQFGECSVKVVQPLLPILSRANVTVPFRTVAEMLRYNQGKNLDLWQLALRYEAERGNVSEDEVFERVRNVANVMQNAIAAGLKGTDYPDRILPPQAPSFYRSMMEGSSEQDLLNWITCYTMAAMDAKSSMEVIVAAPTAGSCGTLPGAIFGAAQYLDRSEDDIVKAMLASGMIGAFIADRSTFAAEEAGCMAETGAAGSMAAAGLVFLRGGTIEHALLAASEALGGSFGLVCDMIGDRVEYPCLFKNTSGAGRALQAANMAIAGLIQVVPFDEVIEAMYRVGREMPDNHCCNGKGGLASTPTGQEVLYQLNHSSPAQRRPGTFFGGC